MKKRLGILFLAGFLIRLIAINQSFWLDEAITSRVISQFTLFQIPGSFSVGDFHPPLYYLFMKMWSMLFGAGEISLRLPSIIFSLLTAHMVYLIGTKLKNEKLGFWAAALYIFNPLAVYYSQEARMYSLITFTLSAATYFYIMIDGLKGYGLRIQKHHLARLRKKDAFFTVTKRLIRHFVSRGTKIITEIEHIELLFLFNLFLVLSVWTFYGSVFYIAGLFVLMIINKQYRYAVITFVVLLLFTFPLFPLLKTQYATSRQSLISVANWKNVLGPVSFKNLALIPMKFSVGRISFEPKWIYYLVSLYWSTVVGYIALQGARKNRQLMILFILPLVLAVIVSFGSPMLQYFRFLYLIPVLSLMLAYGAMRMRENKQVFVVLLGGFMFFSLVYLMYPRFHREDWRRMAQKLPQEPVYMIIPSSDGLIHYAPQANLKELRELAHEWLYERQIYVIPYTSEIYGFDYKSVLYKSGCFPKKRIPVRGIILELWDCGKIG